MSLNTPYYLIDKSKLLANMEKIARLREISGAKALLALKCFATWSVFDFMRDYMDGTTSSSLNEVRLGNERFGKETHAYSVAYADYEIDKADHDAGKKITIPMLALWGDAGVATAAATPLDTWKAWATDVTGSPVDSGHFLTEENPDVTAKLLKEFFSAGL